MPSLYTCALFVLRLRRRPGRRAIGPDRRKAYRREPQVHFVWPIEFRLSRDGTLPAGWTLEVFDVVLSLSPSPHRRLHDPYCTARESSPHGHAIMREQHMFASGTAHPRRGAHRRPDAATRHHRCDTTRPRTRSRHSTGAPSAPVSLESPSRKNGLCGSLNYLNT